jgi:monothiol glutaredoxin
MKGSVSFPLCGLSGEVCFLLKKCNLHFKSVDVLVDPELHTFLKELHANFAIPYLYVSGKFVGGYDELCEMCRSGELNSLHSAYIQESDLSIQLFAR